jgi:hypothetical protein
LAQSLGVGIKVHDKIISNFKRLVPIWDGVIEKSFLEENKKTEFKKLIRKKLERFD